MKPSGEAMGAAKSHGSGCIVAIGSRGGAAPVSAIQRYQPTYLPTSIRGIDKIIREEEEKEKTQRYKTQDGKEKALVIGWGVLLEKKRHYVKVYLSHGLPE